MNPVGFEGELLMVSLDTDVIEVVGVLDKSEGEGFDPVLVELSLVEIWLNEV